MTTDKPSPTQLFAALYQSSINPKEFGQSFGQDPENTIISSRLQSSFSQELVRLLMACVREDAIGRGEDVTAAIAQTTLSIQEALSEAKSRDGFYW